jgi:hypothetical protein
VVPLELLGIYRIVRSISDLTGNLVLRVGSVVLFPFVASQSHVSRPDLIRQLTPLRAKFLHFGVPTLKFDGLQIDSMIADPPGFGEDGSWVDALPRWGSMRWNALS